MTPILSHSRPIRSPILSNYARANRYDPTRTTSLRNRFSADMGRRFSALRRLVWKTIVEDDCFGLGPPYKRFRPTVHAKFDFPSSQAKVDGFMDWLKEQQDQGILETITSPRLGQSMGEPWTNVYIKDTYERGVQRARYEMGQAGYDVPGMEFTGGISASMFNPFHVDRVATLYTRAFSGLKGITDAMDMQISHVLAQGIADGDNPLKLARKMNYVISGMGQDLGVTDSLGRFIPAERRARMLARTEVIRAHAQATLTEYQVWGAAGVEVQAEFVNAGYNVCPTCVGLQGHVYTIQEAMSIIPVHPHCFTDPQTPVYTSMGWRPIGKIEVGDLVLTHKGRFRKVYGLPRTSGQKPEVIRFTIPRLPNKILSMTANHMVLVASGPTLPPRWRRADQVTTNDKLMLLAGECKRCGTPIPWWRTYCSGRCCSRVLMNHAGQYGFILYPISKIERWIPKRTRTLYNLAVEEDESYLAKGIVVHNCRCAWLPKPVEGKGRTTGGTAEPAISKEAMSVVEGNALTDVFNYGLQTGKEKLIAISDTGRTIQAIGDIESVGFSSSDQALINSWRQVTIVHNHPLDKTFSLEDIKRFGDQPGFKKALITRPTGQVDELVIPRNKVFNRTMADSIVLRHREIIVDDFLDAIEAGSISKVQAYEKALIKALEEQGIKIESRFLLGI